MTSFLMSRFCCMLRKEGVLNRFFYMEFDPAILEARKAHREQLWQDCGEPSTFGLRDPKEELVEETTLDLENHRYNFNLRPS